MQPISIQRCNRFSYVDLFLYTGATESHRPSIRRPKNNCFASTFGGVEEHVNPTTTDDSQLQALVRWCLCVSNNFGRSVRIQLKGEPHNAQVHRATWNSLVCKFYIYTYMYVHICVYMYMYMCICVYVYMCICAYVYMCIRVYVYLCRWLSCCISS